MRVNQNLVIPSVILIAIIVAVIFAPPMLRSLFEGARDLFGDLRDTFFEDWGAETNASDLMTIDYTLKFEDGTQREISTDMTALNLMPLTITVPEGTPIAEWHIGVRAIINYVGKATGSVETSGTLDTSIGATRKDRVDLTSTLIPRISGAVYKIKGYPTVVYTKATIESWLGDGGQYTIDTNADLTVLMRFDDGTTDTKSGTASASLTIIYQEDPHGITALTVTVSTYKLGA